MKFCVFYVTERINRNADADWRRKENASCWRLPYPHKITSHKIWREVTEENQKENKK